MTLIINVADITEANGRTTRENNEAVLHEIPIGSLVELGDPRYPESPDEEDPTDGLRLFVVAHARDCDGTPLYSLSFQKSAQQDLDKISQEMENWPQNSRFAKPLTIGRGEYGAPITHRLRSRSLPPMGSSLPAHVISMP